MEALLETLKKFLGSKIIWIQALAIIGFAFNDYYIAGLIKADVAAFIIFSLTTIIQYFKPAENPLIPIISSKQVATKANSTFITINIITVLTIILNYFMENKLFYWFGTDYQKIGIVIASLNTLFRIFLLNQGITLQNPQVQEPKE